MSLLGKRTRSIVIDKDLNRSALFRLRRCLKASMVRAEPAGRAQGFRENKYAAGVHQRVRNKQKASNEWPLASRRIPKPPASAIDHQTRQNRGSKNAPKTKRRLSWRPYKMTVHSCSQFSLNCGQPVDWPKGLLKNRQCAAGAGAATVSDARRQESRRKNPPPTRGQCKAHTPFRRRLN